MLSLLFKRLFISGTKTKNNNNTTQEYNILLLGETGSGKSTTINALANYILHGEFEDAARGDFVEMIPSRFVLSDPVTFEERVIRSNIDDRNELGLSGSAGKSSTREPRTYLFEHGDKVVRLIDTPGVGDTEGTDQDRENFDQILRTLHCFKELHGIVLLVKANETRTTAGFKYCITELLTHLHKSACRNVVVCFTFSRSSFFEPGDGFTTLKGFLATELKEVAIELRPGHNCFFIDNEAYRFLLAKKSGVEFPARKAAAYRESWEKSTEQSDRMFEHLFALSPHDLENTTSLNSARKLIEEIAEPMVRLQNTIDANISHLGIKKAQLLNSTQNKLDLAKNINIQVDDLEQVDLPYPTTVCTANSCVEVINYQNEKKINYITRCHKNCQLSGVQTNKVGHPDLHGCAAMCRDGEYGNPCVVCGCSWQQHMHLTCTFEKVKRSIVDSNKQREVKNADDAIANINAAIGDMQRTVDELRQEMQTIEDIGSKFAYILTEHCNTPYNKFLEPYLNLLIGEERKKQGKGYPRDKLNRLEKMKATHLKSVDILKRAIRNKSHEPVELRDVFKYRDTLCALRHTGPQFAQMLKNTQFMTDNNFKVMEKRLVMGNHSVSETSDGGGSRRVTQVTSQTQQQQPTSSQASLRLNRVSPPRFIQRNAWDKSEALLKQSAIVPINQGKSTIANALPNYHRFGLNFEQATDSGHFEKLSSSPTLVDILQRNRDRALILALVQPLVQLQLNIAHKRSVLETILAPHYSQVQELTEYLEKALYTKFMDLQIHRMQTPMTVCTAPQCTRVCPLDGGGDDDDNSVAATVLYTAQCHSECTEIEPDNCAVGNPLLHDCSVMAPESGKCRSCGCSWRVHMRLAVKYDHKWASLFSKQQIQTIVTHSKSLVDVEARLRDSVQMYIVQLTVAQANLCQFSHACGNILDRCSDQSYSQITDQYISMLEAEEGRKKVAIVDYSTAVYEHLQDLRRRQQQAIDQFAKHEVFDLKNMPELCGFFLKRLQTVPKFAQLIEMFTKEETKA